MMDVRLWPLANRIAEVEHMAVQLQALVQLRKGIINPAFYDFVKRASSNYTAKGWIENRLQKKFPYLTGIIVDSSGRPLKDYESISWARNGPEIIWSEPLEISLSGKDPSQFDLYVPFFREIDADIQPVSKSFFRKWWVMKVITPPVILWGFEYEKVKQYLREVADVMVKLSRKDPDLNARLSECLVFEELLNALSRVTDISHEQDNEDGPTEFSTEAMSEQFGRKFQPNYDRKRVEYLCHALINGPRGVTLGREILEQLDQGYLNQSTYERLSRWVNPKKPEPFAKGIAAEISMLLFGETIERIPDD